jgi:hypothetical protein
MYVTFRTEGVLRDCYAADPMTDSHRPTDAGGPWYASLSQESQLSQGSRSRKREGAGTSLSRSHAASRGCAPATVGVLHF